jgi:hypothetical protein
MGETVSSELGAAPGSELASLVRCPLVFEGVVLHEERIRRSRFADCSPASHWDVVPEHEYHCIRVSVDKLIAGILPAETLVVAVNTTSSHLSDPEVRAGSHIAFFGEFVCSAGDTAAGRICVAAGFWGTYRFSAFSFGTGGDVLTGPYRYEFSTRQLHAAASRDEVKARTTELAGLDRLVLCRVTGNISYTTFADSLQCEPLESLFGMPLGRLPLRLALSYPSCASMPSIGDTVVVPLRPGEPLLGHLKPICLEDLLVRNGFVRLFGSHYDRIVERCYVESSGRLEPRHTPGQTGSH